MRPIRMIGHLLKAAKTGAVPVEDLLTLEAALARLEALDPRAAEVVTLRFFSGMSVPEVGCGDMALFERRDVRPDTRAHPGANYLLDVAK